jgi:nucleoside-diphosphate-sugar epimerase
VLVTGHRGFIGSHLLIRLRSLLQTVVTTNSDVESKREMEKPFLENRFSKIYFLSSRTPSKVRHEQFNSRDYLANIKGVCNLIDVASWHKVPVIYPSSASVYGSSDFDLEETSPLRPRNLYGKHKFVCERMLLDNLEHCTIFRIANTYGPLSLRGDLLEILIRSGLTHKPVELTIHPESERDFVFVSDVVSAMVSGSAFEGIFNIGSERAIRIKDLVEIVGEALNRKIPVTYDKSIVRDRFVLSSRKLRSVTNINQTTSLEEGVTRTAKWLMETV